MEEKLGTNEAKEVKLSEGAPVLPAESREANQDTLDSIGNAKTVQSENGGHTPVSEWQPIGPRGKGIPKDSQSK